jgi:hypothetical protein
MTAVQQRRCASSDNPPQPGPTSNAAQTPASLVRSDDAAIATARRFLNLPDGHGVLERTTRYEMTLWRQLRQTLYVLDLAARPRALRETLSPQSMVERVS